MNIHRGTIVLFCRRLSFQSHLRRIRPFAGVCSTRSKIPGSARYKHDKKRESEGGNPPSGHENPELPCLVLFTPRDNSYKKIRREKTRTRRIVMELRVQLKICEGCGCLWYRAQTVGTVYCRGCEVKLKDFPSPESRKRRGRPGRKPHITDMESGEALGGAQ